MRENVCCFMQMYESKTMKYCMLKKSAVIYDTCYSRSVIAVRKTHTHKHTLTHTYTIHNTHKIYTHTYCGGNCHNPYHKDEIIYKRCWVKIEDDHGADHT